MTPLSREECHRLALKITRKAEELAANPAKGRKLGYRPDYKLARADPTPGALDLPPLLPTRDDHEAWLFAVAERDLQGCAWSIQPHPERAPELIITWARARPPYAT